MVISETHLLEDAKKMIDTLKESRYYGPYELQYIDKQGRVHVVRVDGESGLAVDRDVLEVLKADFEKYSLDNTLKEVAYDSTT